MRRIGLIGGMSWESSAHYYQLINRHVAQRLGGLHSADLVLHSLDFAPIEALQRGGDWNTAGERLATSAEGLTAAGATVIGLATNTMHIVAEQIEERLPDDAQFIHIADPTAAALKSDGYTTVGLLGTRFTMQEPFYRERMEASGLAVLVPEVDQTNLNGIIYEELCRGIIREESRAVYARAIEMLAARGAEAVILGCTEIGLLISDEDSVVPLFDTTALHAEALAEASIRHGSDLNP
ncbi:racemase [Devosia pacifica]|uniref:Racemase n=1 Tax=Devosia pacifica TaxID=1335967 RepID=A0A918VUB3_9HYPH|nr:aspartate/glutamate racemase family protein [Devosia pacifica]GHA24761.1 racemase [Devosia pacifica]